MKSSSYLTVFMIVYSIGLSFHLISHLAMKSKSFFIVIIEGVIEGLNHFDVDKEALFIELFVFVRIRIVN